VSEKDFIILVQKNISQARNITTYRFKKIVHCKLVPLFATNKQNNPQQNQDLT